MKNQKTIQEVIDINELMNEEIFPSLESGQVIDEDAIWHQVVDLTIGYDLWDETDDIWYNEVFKPILEQVKEFVNK